MVIQFPSHSATHVTGRLKELTVSQNQQLSDKLMILCLKRPF